MQQIRTPARLGIEEARITDDSRFEDSVRDRAAALYRSGFVLTGNPHDADDLVQDALLRLRRRGRELATRTTRWRSYVRRWPACT